MVSNVVLFGFGRAGRIHYKNLMESENFNLLYVIDLNDVTEEIDENVICILNENRNDVREKVFNNRNVDSIIISTPTATHYKLIMEGLKSNKHVFIEKPITESIDEIKYCFKTAERNNLILFVGYNRRFDPIIMDIKDKIKMNKIGKINYAFTISRDYPYPKESFLEISGGIFHDCATHDIDYMNWILEDIPKSVYVTVEDDNDTKKNNFNHVTINLKYRKGVIVVLNLSRISSSYDQRCEFFGEKGEIINNEFKKDAGLSFPERYSKAFKNELEEFYLCIKKKKKCLITMNECLNNLIIANACEKSIVDGGKIEIIYN